MLTIYSPVQCTHQPAYVVKQGERSASFDVPERVDSILSAINEHGLGPVITPVDAGLEPIRTVHDTGMIEYLMTAYERQNASACASRAIYPFAASKSLPGIRAFRIEPELLRVPVRIILIGEI